MAGGLGRSHNAPALNLKRTWAGWLLTLTLLVLVAMLWLGLHSAREANREKIIAALDTTVGNINALARVVEITAQSVERVVASVGPSSPAVLRTALETAVVAFRQTPELSHIGVILGDAARHGNLERAADGTIRMWLYPGEHSLADILHLTPTGFAVDPTRVADRQQGLKIPPVYERGLQGNAQGIWELRQHPWMLHDASDDSPWGVSYTKALRDDTGTLLGVLDANFDLSQVHEYMNAIRAIYDIQLDMIVLDDPPILITDGTRMPQPMPAVWQPLLDLVDMGDNTFADVMQVGKARHWVAARSVAFHGGKQVLFVASRPVSLFSAIHSGMRWHMWVLALLIVGVALEGTRRMLRYLGRTDSGATDEDLHYLATHDALTNLPNQGLLRQRMLDAIGQTRARHVALLYLDINRFKLVNSNHGYLFGNAVLKGIGAMLQTLIRREDTIAHFGADHFLILLTDVQDIHSIEQLAQRILHALQHHLIVDGSAVPLAASIGVARFPQHGQTPDELIQNAEIAMRVAKEGASVQIFNTRMARQSTRHLALQQGLRTALADGQLRLVYQPKFSLQSGHIIGCEALLRWHHPDLGEVSPAQFIPIAEETGLILPIGDWVLETACAQARAWLDAGLAPVRVAVNLSAGQFFRRDVVTWVTDALQRTRLPAHCLQLELTESLHPQDMDRTIETFKRLQSLGVFLAIDDFGTGYSNLNHLKRFPIQTLKIDQSFIRNAMTSPQDAAIVRAVIALAHHMNFTVLAEGVETEAQVVFLREEQCDEVQGYYFSLPLTPDAYTHYLHQGKIPR